MKTNRIVHALLLALCSTAFAASAAVNSAFQDRKDNFTAMGRSMKAITDELKRPTPNSATIKANARALARSAPKVAGYFPKGTGPEAGVKTDALPSIWQKPAEFKSTAARLVQATQALEAAAGVGDIAATRTAVGAVGQTCKSCHDNFRKPRS